MEPLITYLKMETPRTLVPRIAMMDTPNLDKLKQIREPPRIPKKTDILLMNDDLCVKINEGKLIISYNDKYKDIIKDVMVEAINNSDMKYIINTEDIK